jgi:hypothetical protein
MTRQILKQSRIAALTHLKYSSILDSSDAFKLAADGHPHFERETT